MSDFSDQRQQVANDRQVKSATALLSAVCKIVANRKKEIFIGMLSIYVASEVHFNTIPSVRIPALKSLSTFDPLQVSKLLALGWSSGCCRLTSRRAARHASCPGVRAACRIGRSLWQRCGHNPERSKDMVGLRWSDECACGALDRRASLWWSRSGGTNIRSVKRTTLFDFSRGILALA